VSMRYAQLYNTLFVCFSFSTGMPVMLPILAASAIVFYWVDKTTFMWFFRSPKTSGVKTQGLMSSLLPIALLLHLGIGVWQLSAVPSIAALANGVAAYKSLVALTNPWVDRATLLVASLHNAALLAGVKRVTDTGVLPLFIMFLVIAAALLLWAVVRALSGALITTLNVLTCNVCSRCRIKNSNPWYFDIPSYTWATDHAANKDDPRWKTYRLQGLPSYNILMNPEIMQAFAIPKSFAKTHHHLTDVALFRGESARRVPVGTVRSPPRLPLPGARASLSIRELPVALQTPPAAVLAAPGTPEEEEEEEQVSEDEEGYFGEEDVDSPANSPTYKASVRRFITEPMQARTPRSGTSV